MAQPPREALAAVWRGFNQLSNARKLGLIAGIAGIVAIAAYLLILSSTPQYRVLFANVSEADGGAIIAQLAQMNVPYKVADGGGAILVPSEVVYQTRLQLASQGLPKGGGVGFELMENQKFGSSQFLEQVNYQRALEGELSRTIRSLQEVRDARVHLAIPRPSVFLRENQKPSASVLVTVHPGRTLDPAQVSGVVNLIASSVPELSPRSVTVVDQAGNLLSGTGDEMSVAGLDGAQLKYLHRVEEGIARKIENILRPIAGPDNVRAQVAALLDFSEVEQTSETFRPNNDPKDQAMRSQQVAESTSQTPQPPQGVPGALSNTPPGAATAPLVAPQAGANANGQPQMATTSQRDATTNFELDKTIRHTKSEVGTIKRLSVAVLVNHKKVVDGGKTQLVPYDEKEMAQIQNLVREAMGFDTNRGDTLNIVNAAFQTPTAEPELPFYQRPENIEWAIKTGVIGIFGLVALFLVLSAVRELVRLTKPPEPVAAGAEGGEATLDGAEREAAGTAGEAVEGGGGEAGEGSRPAEETEHERNLRFIRELAKENPRLVAQIIKGWMNGE